MSYVMMGYGDAAEMTVLPSCDANEHYDEAASICVCDVGYAPSPIVGQGCVALVQGGVTGDSCVAKGMDYDLASQTCIPRCPPGQGRDVNGNCVSVQAYDVSHGLVPPPSAEGTFSAGNMGAAVKTLTPWLIGGAIGVGALVLFTAMAGKKKKAA